LGILGRKGVTKANKKNRNSTKKAYITVFVAFLTLSLALASIAAAAGAITLTPMAQAPGASVTVNGTGFGATKAVGIGFGEEANVTNEVVNATGPYDVDVGPYVESLSYWPVKPGSFQRESGIMFGGSYIPAYLYWDDGNGTISTDNTAVVSATIDYITGKASFYFTSPLSSSENYVRIVNYTRYQFNVTPAAGVTTLASGAFSASITVPSVADGYYVLTAVDTAGNIATATLGVDHTIPEGLTFSVMVLLSAIAVTVSVSYFRKRPKWQNW
jgi:hypothetical protein